MYRDSNLLYWNLEENAQGHNQIFKFNDLTEDWDNGNVSKWIASGKFTNIFPGCYIRKTKTIDGVTYTDHIDIVVECDPYYGMMESDISGNTIQTHHMAIIPYNPLGKASMNTTSSSEGGYLGSAMVKTILPKYLSGYNTAYDNRLLPFSIKASNKIASDTQLQNGLSISIQWERASTKIALMTENQLTGTTVWGFGRDCGDGCNQFALFRLNHQMQIKNGVTYWLRSVSSTTAFASFTYGGALDSGIANSTAYVVPYILIY